MNSKLRSRKWLVISASIFVMMLDYGFLYALGTMFVYMLDKFGENRSKTATIQSIYNGVAFIMSTLTGLFVSKFGTNNGMLASAVLIPTGFFISFFAKTVIHLYFSLGVLCGIGNSFLFISCVVAVGQIFPASQRSMALSIQMMFMGLASIIYPYFLDWLLDMYGLNGTFLLLSGLYLHTFIAAITFRYELFSHDKRPESETDREKGSSYEITDVTNDSKPEDTKTTDKNQQQGNYSEEAIAFSKSSGRLCSPTFIIFSAASAMLVGNITGFITIAEDLFVTKGFSKSQSLSGFLTFNICNTVSRLAPGMFSKLNLSSFTTSLIASVLGLSGQMLTLFTNSFVLLMVGSGLSGAALGGFAASVVTATFEILGPTRHPIGFGIIVTINGVSITCIGPLFGAMRDASEEYDTVLMTTSSLNALCLLLIIAIMVFEYRNKQRLPKTVQ